MQPSKLERIKIAELLNVPDPSDEGALWEAVKGADDNTLAGIPPNWAKRIREIRDLLEQGQMVQHKEEAPAPAKPAKKAKGARKKGDGDKKRERPEGAGRKNWGGLQAIVEILEKNNEASFDEIKEELHKRGMKYADSSIRRRIIKARKQLGITATRSRGIGKAIQELWAAGVRNPADVAAQLQERGFEAPSFATIKGRLRRLRKMAVAADQAGQHEEAPEEAVE